MRMSLDQFFYLPTQMRLNRIKVSDSYIIPFKLNADTNMKFFEVSQVSLAYYPSRMKKRADNNV